MNLVTPVGLSDYHMYYEHLMKDIIPAIYCCKGKYRLGTCRLYYEQREYKTNETCELPRPGRLSTCNCDIVRDEANSIGENQLHLAIIIKGLREGK